MMIRQGILAVFAGLSALAAAPALAGPPPAPKAAARSHKLEPLPPRTAAGILFIMRGLSELQQQTVLGNRDALLQQPSLAIKISEQLKTADRSVWAVASARYGLIRHVLSGGDATMLLKLLEDKAFPAAELPLALGARAYARGDLLEASARLSEVDPRSLDSGFGGHVALVRAVIVRNADPTAALALAEEARLLSPGTVIEETALRLAIELCIAGGDLQRFKRTSKRYLIRFPASLYSDAMHARIAGVLALSGDVETARGVEFLEGIAFALSPELRRRFYYQIAEAALRGGKLVTAERAAKLARSVAATAPPADAHLLAIEAAALLVGPRRDEARKMLGTANPAVAGEARELLAAARALATMIDEPPSNGAPRTVTQKGQAPAQAGRAAPTSPDGPAVARFESLAARVQTVVSTADKRIEEAGQ